MYIPFTGMNEPNNKSRQKYVDHPHHHHHHHHLAACFALPQVLYVASCPVEVISKE